MYETTNLYLDPPKNINEINIWYDNIHQVIIGIYMKNW